MKMNEMKWSLFNSSRSRSRSRSVIVIRSVSVSVSVSVINRQLSVVARAKKQVSSITALPLRHPFAWRMWPISRRNGPPLRWLQLIIFSLLYLFIYLFILIDSSIYFIVFIIIHSLFIHCYLLFIDSLFIDLLSYFIWFVIFF